MTDSRRSASPGPGVEDPRVTVVVVSRNRRDELLASLPRHAAPVILVDNASTDGTADAVRATLPHIRVVTLRRNVGAFARTIGTQLAGTELVAFADDDSWWAPGALRTAADVLAAEPDLGAVCARIAVGPEERPDPMNDVMATSALGGHPYPRLTGFVACAAMVRRSHFLAVGGFDDVVRFPGEEERVTLDLLDAGHAVVHVPEAVVHHHPSPSRHGPDVRRAAVTRSAVLTAVMRLPWPEVRRRVRAAVGDTPGRRGAAAALPDLLRALRRRRVVTASTLDDLVLTGGAVA